MEMSIKQAVLGTNKLTSFVDEGTLFVPCTCGRFVPFVGSTIERLLQKTDYTVEDGEKGRLFLTNCAECSGERGQLKIISKDGE